LDIDGYLRIYLDKYPWRSLMDMWVGYVMDMSGYPMDIFSGYLFWISPKRYPKLPKYIQAISFHIHGYPFISLDIHRYPNGVNSQMWPGALLK
jgi:hypothetical protein